MLVGYTECARKYAEKRGIPVSEAEKQFKDAVEVIVDQLKEENSVCFKKYFTLSVAERKGRTGTLPNGDKYQSTTEKVVKLKTSPFLKEELNK